MIHVRKALRKLFTLPATLLRGMITLYQHTLSFDHGPLKFLYPYGYCKHTPTCSEYAKIVLQKRSFFVAIFLSVKRILSCHPWAKISDEKMKEWM
jgi:putative component of membrane protein insertase Oxa1/YidC/SpoIIIJ protein YidD